MARRITVLACAAAALLGAKAPPGPRPGITGISHLAVYARDMAKSEHFYTHVLGARKGTDPENPAGVRYYLSSRQFVEVLPAPAGQGPSMLAHVAYATTDAATLRAWLAASGVSGLGAMQRSPEGDRWFALRDPE